MRIVFIGTVEFSKKTLEKLIQINADIVGVCTKKKSSFNSDFADLSLICSENIIPYKYVDDINSKETFVWISSLTPDIIFCFGWSSLIKKELLNLAPMGILGYHPAKLPQNRGRHPLIWALALGLKKSASTFFFMNEGADSGDILSQEEFDILYEDDAKSLYDKVINLSLSQINEFIPLLQNNKYKLVVQDHKKSSSWRKRSKKDGLIDFRMSSNSIYNLVRALSKPYVGAHIVYNERDIIIWKVEVIKYFAINIESGKVLESNQKFITVKTYDGAVKIIEHEFDNIPKVGEYL